MVSYLIIFWAILFEIEQFRQIQIFKFLAKIFTNEIYIKAENLDSYKFQGFFVLCSPEKVILYPFKKTWSPLNLTDKRL